MPQIQRNTLPGFTLSLALALTLTLSSCLGPSTIRKDGLSYIKLNDSMPAANLAELNGYPITHSEMKENGYAWRVCTLAYENGQVLLESDFQNKTRVNRIRVETPALKTKGGLKVGDQLTDLNKKTPKWNARPYPQYQLMELTSPKYPRTVFLLRVAGFDYSIDQAEVSTADLSGESMVVGIVLL